MIPYISNIDSNAKLVCFILFILGSADLGILCCISVCLDNGEPSKLRLLMGGFLGGLFAYCMLWMLVGDSVWWSKPIGAWLKN